MSRHRYPCPAKPPRLNENTLPCRSTGGPHECMHAAADNKQAIAEHQCRCGMTWRATSLRPPPDLSWITYEDRERGFWKAIGRAFTWGQR